MKKYVFFYSDLWSFFYVARLGHGGGDYKSTGERGGGELEHVEMVLSGGEGANRAF